MKAAAAATDVEPLTEGWRAVLSIVGRAGMGARRRRRRRSDLFGMELVLASDTVREGEEEGGSTIGKKQGASIEVDEGVDKVDEMVESVKRGGVCLIFRLLRCHPLAS